MIQTKIVTDSTNWLGTRITTLVLIYPRYIHSEFMTHRMFSRNSSSSRAIPTDKLIQEVKDNTVNPMWTRNKKGMQGELIQDPELVEALNKDWVNTRDYNINEASALNQKGVHKQHANRILEPFQHITIICTGTDWNNFFELRDHPDAMPEIQDLARAVKLEMEHSKPKFLEPGDWHLPFGDRFNEAEMVEKSYEKLYNGTNWEVATKKSSIYEDVLATKIKAAVARCARVSYLNFDGKADIDKDIELYDRLLSQDPKHFSPTEHIARVPHENELKEFKSAYNLDKTYSRGKYCSNLSGWIQLRKLIENGEF